MTPFSIPGPFSHPTDENRNVYLLKGSFSLPFGITAVNRDLFSSSGLFSRPTDEIGNICLLKRSLSLLYQVRKTGGTFIMNTFVNTVLAAAARLALDGQHLPLFNKNHVWKRHPGVVALRLLFAAHKQLGGNNIEVPSEEQIKYFRNARTIYSVVRSAIEESENNVNVDDEQKLEYVCKCIRSILDYYIQINRFK